MKWFRCALVFVTLTLLNGCKTSPSQDYSAFIQSDPKSILVLPPINNSNEVIAPYSVMATVIQPLADSGYYVFPVSLVQETFKSNGLAIAHDVHNVAPSKLHEIFSADAALYIEVQDYGTSYIVIDSDTKVALSAKLVDLQTGQVIWQGHAQAASSEDRDDNDNSLAGALIGAVLNQVIESTFDMGFEVSQEASQRLLSAGSTNGLLYGPRSPKYGQLKE
ncbi:DUF799 domain-containing protein [Pseudoalteromonas sp. McH1-7]|uniref:DUF799 domain-containing protein n=1 Tax=Pseudoalteromonas TaxID=53246 RepID=UPI00158FA856|nr:MULTISPECIES: DUF799 domain-containing protein [Pseudoalteromonas]MDW7550830.1 DUF799 domain-containing protein [Pseudoalteromonas peptidolytica]NUZ11393.1 DUF799 domain-containing protein [Pseudoalteromonas sp. McH1-7]USD28701.1 DUF799 domain-containing protein [Pseudoalteromonas sp. SCSIO 43201]